MNIQKDFNEHDLQTCYKTLPWMPRHESSNHAWTMCRNLQPVPVPKPTKQNPPLSLSSRSLCTHTQIYSVVATVCASVRAFPQKGSIHLIQPAFVPSSPSLVKCHRNHPHQALHGIAECNCIVLALAHAVTRLSIDYSLKPWTIEISATHKFCFPAVCHGSNKAQARLDKNLVVRQETKALAPST